MVNEKLHAVYNGSELITSNGFTMVSRFILPVLSRMKLEKLLTESGADVLQAILTYKFDERKPFPSQEELASYLGKAVRTIEEGIKSIKKCGILGISKKINEATGKKTRNNEYDFSPFFALLEKFIQVFHIEGNKDVQISELLKMKAVKKEDKDFGWSAKYAEVKKEVVAVAEVTEEVVEEVVAPAEPVAPVCVLPKSIMNIIEFHNISSEGIVAVEKAYTSFGATLDDIIFIDKINASASKKNFVNYFNACITKAYATNEQPKQAPQQDVQAPSKRSYDNNKQDNYARKERVPNWLKEKFRKEEEEARIAQEIEANKSVFEKIDDCSGEYTINQYLETITVTPEIREYADARIKQINEEIAKAREELFAEYRKPVTTETKEGVI